jgi:hypothetical protein
MNYKFILAFVVVMAAFILPVSAANITYPNEYYAITDRINGVYSGGTPPTVISTDGAFLSALELHRQNYLIEKQNQLLAEQVEAQWVDTCYAPRGLYYSYANKSAWIEECANAGYPTGDVRRI